MSDIVFGESPVLIPLRIAATILGLSVRQIKLRIKSGELPAVTQRGRIFVPRGGIADYISQLPTVSRADQLTVVNAALWAADTLGRDRAEAVIAEAATSALKKSPLGFVTPTALATPPEKARRRVAKAQGVPRKRPIFVKPEEV